MDRPICIFRNGQLFLDEGGNDYTPAPEYRVRFKLHELSQWPDSHQERIATIREALRQYEESQKETAK